MLAHNPCVCKGNFLSGPHGFLHIRDAASELDSDQKRYRKRIRISRLVLVKHLQTDIGRFAARVRGKERTYKTIYL